MKALILDLHGVLVNTKLMKENYEMFLIELYNEYNIDRKTAKIYHKKGLKQFFSSIKEIKKKNILGEKFSSEMRRSDKIWDELMREPILSLNIEENLHKIESRFVEENAGKIRSVLFPDAENFIEEWETKYSDRYKLMIASNSHFSHIKGAIDGFNKNLSNKITILGWETLECLKSHHLYFEQLRKIIDLKYPAISDNIMIGNSTEEILGSLKFGFVPILIERDRVVSKLAKAKAKQIFSSLNGVWEYLEN